MKVNLSGNTSGGETIDGMTPLPGFLVYKSPSATRQGRYHLTCIDMEMGTYPVCSCEGYQFRGKCKHADALHEHYFKGASNDDG
jgi:hypothetical protein